MARYRRKKALYELITKARSRSGYGRPVEKLHPKEETKDEPETIKCATPTPEWVSRWQRRPKIVQFVSGRVEISMPYQLVIAMSLGIILLVLVAFRIGQYSSRSMQTLPAGGAGMAKGTTPLPTAKKPPLTTTAPKVAGAPAKLQGDHRIVIQQYHRPIDLEYVQRYFRANGIETVIEKRGDRYFLLTKNTYQNPKRAGTDGAAALKKIKQIGAEYKAPRGYESFAPRLFSDAYGEKIK